MRVFTSKVDGEAGGRHGYGVVTTKGWWVGEVKLTRGWFI
jgi:hypothetical protein